MNASQMGQAAVALIVCGVAGVVIGQIIGRPAERALRAIRYHLGFLRGYREGNRDRETAALLRRVGAADESAEPRDPVRFASTIAAWRTRQRRLVTSPITPLRARLDRLDAQDDGQDEDEDAWQDRLG